MASSVTKLSVGTRLYNSKAKAWYNVVKIETIWQASEPKRVTLVSLAEDGEAVPEVWDEKSLHDTFLKGILTVFSGKSEEERASFRDMTSGWARLHTSGIGEGWHWQVSEDRPVYIYNFAIAERRAYYTTMVNSFLSQPPGPMTATSNMFAPHDLLVPSLVYHGSCVLTDLARLDWIGMRKTTTHSGESRLGIGTWVWSDTFNAPVLVVDVVRSLDRPVIAVPNIIYESVSTGISELESGFVHQVSDWNLLTRIEPSTGELDY